MLSGDEAHTLRKEIVSALCRNYGSLPNNALLLALLPHTVGEGDGGGESYMTGIKYLRCSCGRQSTCAPFVLVCWAQFSGFDAIASCNVQCALPCLANQISI